MGKSALGLAVSLLMVFLPSLVQAQAFRAGGFNGLRGGFKSGVSGFRNGDFSRGSAFPGSKRGFVRGGVDSAPMGMGLGSGSKDARFTNESGFVKRGFSHGFSSTSRASFGGISNLSPSTLNTPTNTAFSSQSQDPIYPRGGLSKSTRSGFRGFSSGSFNTTGFDSSTLEDRIGVREKRNTTLIGSTGSTSIGKRTGSFAISNKTVFRSGVVLGGASTVTGVNRGWGIEERESDTAQTGFSTPPDTRGEIVHWIDKKSGVLHFSNNLTSFRKGRETITFVNGKRVDSKRGELNSNKILTTTSRSLKSPFSASDPIRPKTKRIGGSSDIDSGLVASGGLGADTTLRHRVFHHSGDLKVVDHPHFHHHHPVGLFFFINPFFSFPSSTFFFGFNPFVFKSLVLSPFVFRPLVPSPFFPFNPLIPPPVLFNDLVFQPLFFPPFFSPFFCSFPFGFGSSFFFNGFVFAFNDPIID